MKSFVELNGIIILRNSGIAIVCKNIIATTFHDKGEIEIPYCNISRVEVVQGSLVNGFISIVEYGNSSPSNIFSAMKDRNTIVFRFTKNGEADKIKQIIESKI